MLILLILTMMIGLCNLGLTVYLLKIKPEVKCNNVVSPELKKETSQVFPFVKVVTTYCPTDEELAEQERLESKEV